MEKGKNRLSAYFVVTPATNDCGIAQCHPGRNTAAFLPTISVCIGSSTDLLRKSWPRKPIFIRFTSAHWSVVLKIFHSIPSFASPKRWTSKSPISAKDFSEVCRLDGSEDFSLRPRRIPGVLMGNKGIELWPHFLLLL